jgi:hypothetical protein
LLERSRRVEELCLRDWLPLERERASHVRRFERAMDASFDACGAPASSDWWQTRMAKTAQALRDSLRDIELRWEGASAALQAAKLQRGVFEKLEQRFARGERIRRERRERHEYEEANALIHSAAKRIDQET